MLSLFINFLLGVNVLVSLLIIFIVLMQRPKSEGLGAAFGGGMTENLFGAQTSNVLANATRWLGGIFFFLSLLLSILTARQSMQHSAIQAAAIRAAAALATPAPSASPAAGAAAVSGTAGISGSAAPFSAAEVKLAVPAASPSDALLPAAAAASPAATAATAAPAATGTGH
jgi:preprotein translocase subunit SecG